MKKLMVIIAILLINTACNKKYTYIEVVRQQQLFGGSSVVTKEAVRISARSDTAAYIEAYKQFCISCEVYLGMQQKGLNDLLDVPIGFKLYNSRGNDISNIKFISKREQEQKMEETINRIGTDVFN